MARLEIQLEQDLLDKLNKNCEEGKRSELVRDAIEEKLSRKKIADDPSLEVIKFVKKIDPELIIKKQVEQELLIQFVYEEIKNQNEALKLILRRSTFGSAFSAEILEINDEDLKNQTLAGAEELIKTNLETLGWGVQKNN